MPLPKISTTAMSSKEYGSRAGDFIQVAVHYPCCYDCNTSRGPGVHMFGLLQHVCAQPKNKISQEELRWKYYEKKARKENFAGKNSSQAVWDRSQLMIEDPKDDREAGRASLEVKRGAFSEVGLLKPKSVVSFPSEVGLPVVTAGNLNPVAFGSLQNVSPEAALRLGNLEKGYNEGKIALIKKEDLGPNVGGSSTGASISIPLGPRAQIKEQFLANLTEAEAKALLDHEVFKQRLKLTKDEIKNEVRQAHENSLQAHLMASVRNPNVAKCFGSKTARLIEEYKARIKAELEAGYKSERENMMKPESMAATCRWTDADVRTFISSNSETRRVVEDVIKANTTRLFETWKTEYKADIPVILKEHTTPVTIAAACGWTDRQTRDFIANNPTAKQILTENVKAKLGKLVGEEKVKFKELIHTQFEQEVEEQVNLKIAKYREEEQAKTTAEFDKGSQLIESKAEDSMRTQTSASSAPAKHPLFGLGSASLSQNNLHLAPMNAMKRIAGPSQSISGYIHSTWYSPPALKRTRELEDLESADSSQKRLCGEGGSKL